MGSRTLELFVYHLGPRSASTPPIQAGSFFARESREKMRIKESKKREPPIRAVARLPSLPRRGVFDFVGAHFPRSKERGNLKAHNASDERGATPDSIYGGNVTVKVPAETRYR